VTWLVISYAAQSGAAGVAGQASGGRLGPADTALLAKPVGTLIWSSARLSLLTMALALLFASVAGLAGAMAVTTGERGRWVSLGPIATILWIAPTFIIAILVQELQAFIYGQSGLVVAAGFAEVNPIQVFWVSFILAVRPTAYFFQQARGALDLDVTTE
jgi:ABC-type dipeptide/oligopeptide/nickel transport system permease component